MGNFRISLSSHGVLTSDQLSSIETVFKRIVLQPWFSPSLQDKQQFGAYVLQAYFRGMVDTEKLYDLCLAAAKSRYTGTAVPPADMMATDAGSRAGKKTSRKSKAQAA